MKKFLVLFIISMLVMSSIPFVSAREDAASRDNRGRENVGSRDIRDGNERDDLDSSERDELDSSDTEGTESELGTRLRDRLKSVNEDVREKIIDKREFRKLKLKSREVSTLRSKLRECNETESEDCREIKREAKEWAINSLKGITERTLTILNKLKISIDESSAEKKDEILSEINTAIGNIEKANIASLTRESSREEIKEAISQLKNALREAREVIDKYYAKGHITVQRLQNAIKKYNKLSDKIESRLNRFEERGLDFSGLKTRLKELRDNVASAEANLNKGNLEASLNDLKDAHKITISILKEFRANQERENNEVDVETGDTSEQQ